MAKVTKKATAKRRVKKNVEHGQAHIQSSFNNTIVTLTMKETLFHGQVLVVLDLEVQENLLLMQHRWQLRLQQKLHLFMV